MCKYDAIDRPIITEKSMNLVEFGKYSFVVGMNTDKLYIKKVIEEIFNVKVIKINSLITLGKRKRFKGKIGKQKDRKKVVVTLEKGQSIDFMAKG